MFTLTKETTSVQDALADRHQWPLRITATNSADDTAAKIFVMQKAPPGEFVADLFSCVASVPQMDELPEDEAGTGSPFYRVNQITVVCRNADLALELWLKIQAAVQDLADNTAAATHFTSIETVTLNPSA